MSPTANLVARAPASATADADDAVGVTFAAGLFGFPECRRFRLTGAGRTGLFWLESLEHLPLRFVVADPFIFFPGYAVELGRPEETALDVRDPADIAVLTIVTLPAAAECWTANLQAPIALNLRNGRARQVVIGDPAIGVRAPFDPLSSAA